MLKRIVPTLFSLIAFGLLFYIPLEHHLNSISLIDLKDYYNTYDIPFKDHYISFYDEAGETLKSLQLSGLVFFLLPGALGLLFSFLDFLLENGMRLKFFTSMYQIILGFIILVYNIFYAFNNVHDLRLTSALYMVGGILLVISGGFILEDRNSKRKQRLLPVYR
jgi:hypothetical protein